ncbi:ABC transporter substrate-binding protein [Chakrabartyella piscis]|uniref:ABC transporter substrate-binding protein n=1 Tax=Chakrabartyella piscis TaxID=2918914 RepID=UPI002958D10B|nr:ABC transporter substrate-binding protein [Chakrabartyella piscis]
MRKLNKKWLMTAFSFIMVLFISKIAVSKYYEQLDYIDGNVLNLPYINNWNDDDLLDNPWKNSQFHNALMFRSLFLADSKFQNVEYDLAQSYNISSDGLEYYITLKEDILWSDGEPLTVDDIMFSFQSILQSKTANGLYLTAFSKIKGYEEFKENPLNGLSGLKVTGDNSFVIELSVPHPTMMQVLAQFVILPEHALKDADIENIDQDEYWKSPIVSGMYKVNEVVSYETVQLIRNEYYAGVSPNIEEVVLHMNYKFANLDYYSTNNITEIINYRSMRYMNEHKVDILFYRYFVFNMNRIDEYENSAMLDINVRNAISMAINREELLYINYLDSGTIIESGVPTSNSSYNGQTIVYDPEKAKELLEQSDYDLSRPLQLAYYYTDNTTKAFMENVAKNLESIGFVVELNFISSTTELYEDREYDLLLKGLSAFDVSEWYIEYTDKNPNLSRLLIENSDFNVLVEELSTTVDETREDAILRELQELEHENMYKLPLFTLGQVLYINEDRVNLPNNCSFGNTWYKYDVDFENWSIKKE